MKIFTDENLGMVKGFVLGIVFWISGIKLQQVDLILGIALKSVSFISFSILIIINIPKAYLQIKNWFKK